MDNLHPYFGTIEMRRISADCLDIGTTDARGGVINLNRRIPGKRLLITQGIVIPSQLDGSRTLCNGSYLGDNRNKVAGSIQLLEEIKTGLSIVQRTTIRECGCINRLNGLIGRLRITSQSNLTLVLRVEQIG